jgi:hypothetical protein
MRPFAWRRWWSAGGLPTLRLLAVEHWDPQNVYDDPSRADAYDAYLDRVGRMLRRGKGADDIAHYLGQVRTKAMRLDESPEADAEFADRVTAWYALERPDA